MGSKFLKFMISKKATKIDEIFTVNLYVYLIHQNSFQWGSKIYHFAMRYPV